MPKCTTLLIDTHPLLMEGIRSLLSPYPDINIIGVANTCKQALALARENKPQLIIMEIDLPCKDGLSTASNLRKVTPNSKILIYTRHEDQRFLQELIQIGIVGYVMKSDSKEIFLQAIEKAKNGHVFFSGYDPGGFLVMRMRERFSNSYDDDLTILSNREKEIFLLLAEGLPIRDIAKALHISPKTIESHKYNLFNKLHIKSLSELIKLAIKQGIIQL